MSSEPETAQIKQSELLYLALKNLHKCLNYLFFYNSIDPNFALQYSFLLFFNLELLSFFSSRHKGDVLIYLFIFGCVGSSFLCEGFL